MYQLAKPLFFRTETSLHAGSGSDLGHIDLPIQREKHTDLPNIQSSGLKGAFRQSLEQSAASDSDKIGIHLAFGYDKDGVEGIVKTFFANPDEQDYAGSLAFTDARLLLFPIKSFKGIYALATCPMIIKKFIKEMNFVCDDIKIEGDLSFSDLGTDRIAVANSEFLVMEGGKVILEEYAIQTNKDCAARATALASELKRLLNDSSNEITNRLVVLPDDVFRDFTRLSTEVVTRTKINNSTGTVQAGALFTEEYLPSESYLYTIVATSNVFQTEKNKTVEKRNSYPKAKETKDGEPTPMISYKQVMDFFSSKLKEIIQIGGNSTLGKGIVKLFKNNL